MSIDRKTNRGLEILRFLVTGIVCAIADFIVSYFVLAGLVKTGMESGWANALSIAAGFVIGVILNYILSTFWVFQNVRDEKASKKPLFIVLFVILSAGAMLLSIGTMQLCAFVCLNAWNIDIISKADTIVGEIFSWTFWGDIAFWAYFISFAIKTFVGLVWNYLTRKLILYREPKKEDNIDAQ